MSRLAVGAFIASVGNGSLFAVCIMIYAIAHFDWDPGTLALVLTVPALAVLAVASIALARILLSPHPRAGILPATAALLIAIAWPVLAALFWNTLPPGWWFPF
jgi:hypothetical protein